MGAARARDRRARRPCEKAPQEAAAGDGEELAIARAREDPLEDRRSYHRYVLDEGWEVYAGRTDADNDRLSVKLARPSDWWFHVRGMPGSHVVLRVAPGEEPSRAVLEQAAAIAAYHSKAREGGVVAVSGTRANHVTKPRGAQPGTVQIRKERVFKVRPALPT